MTNNHYPEIDVKENILNNIINWYNSQKKYNQVSLASALGISRQSVTRWLNRVCIPDTGLWFKLCEIMNISIIEFLGLNQNAALSPIETLMVDHYKEDLSFNSFIDRYFSDENFKRTIDSLTALTK